MDTDGADNTCQQADAEDAKENKLFVETHLQTRQVRQREHEHHNVRYEIKYARNGEGEDLVAAVAAGYSGVPVHFERLADEQPVTIVAMAHAAMKIIAPLAVQMTVGTAKTLE
jgi:hypothetical protein